MIIVKFGYLVVDAVGIVVVIVGFISFSIMLKWCQQKKIYRKKTVFFKLVLVGTRPLFVAYGLDLISDIFHLGTSSTPKTNVKLGLSP